ncbi:hypothetical protein [Aquibacillus saliphilus]|uniref:hypothetical protein n=1 Tax=Aquibacillus saliphilus TaxID=1909422 RepID=UPI001CF059A4|nr:hypothetical protein [Aquibacillus saliphilus]
MIKSKASLYIITSIIVISVLTGCSLVSEEEALADAHEVAAKTFKQETIETNTDLEHFSLYLPAGFEVTDETQSNLILENDDQTYILFYNALEDTTSELNYQAAATGGNSTLLESFDDEDRFGYIKVLAIEEHNYELQVGVGGVKITTHTSKGKLKENSEEMMSMATSIAYTSQN